MGLRSLPLALAILSGCAGSATRVRVHPPPSPLRLIAVTPVSVRYDTDRAESARRTEDILSLLWNETRWPVLGPTEFTLLDPRAEDPLRGTDVLLQVRGQGVTPPQIAVLRTVVSLREAVGGTAVTGRGAVGRASSYNAKVVVHITLAQAGGATLADLELIHPLDPLREVPDWDQRPDVRDVVVEGIRLLIDRLGDAVTPGPSLPLQTAPSASAILRGYLVPGDPIPEMDTSAEQELRAWRAAQYFRHDISIDEAVREDQNPPGFCLLPPVAPPFFPGDCVVAQNGKPLTSPHALRRVRALQGPDAELLLTVVGEDGIARRVSY